MAHLGRSELALLHRLSTEGRQACSTNGNKVVVGDGAEFRAAVLDILVRGGLVTRTDSGNGNAELDLSDTGRSELDNAMARKWVVDHSGLHEDSHTYRFEVPDPVTGRRFIVAVTESAGTAVANRAAYGVIGAPSVRDSCRKIETIGMDGGFSVQVAIEGAGEVSIWRKL